MATVKRGPAKPALPEYRVLWNGGECTTTMARDAMVVFNALSRAFTFVQLLRNNVVVLQYDNR